MTIDISNNNPRINYSVAEGVTQTTFSVPFEFFEDGDLTVYVDGVEKTITTDYSVTGGDGSTGTIQFVTADPGETQQVTGATGGSTVTIVRDIPIERTTDFTAGADINRAALNTQLDTIIGLIADVDDRASRSLQLNDYETGASVTLPSLDSRKGYTLAFNASTGDAEVGPLVTDVAAASTHATNAAASATAAAASESNAATSETNAASSATAAATSATSAETSEVNAASSATAAASSETNASASETAAATSATNAATSATSAASSATAAAASETNASASETAAASSQMAAATSATAAASSATAAASSATAASTSETNAASSETAAATSATNAATSATNAATSETNAATSASAASTSASNAATSATNAATSETNAATSATNAASSATSAASAQTAAEAARDATLLAYDNFDDRYLGAKASDPTLDNDGNALVAGSLYFNTTAGEMKVYTGSVWVAAYVSGTGFLASANNLSDLTNAATARTNLGLGTAATTDSTAYATAAQGSNADAAFGWGNHASAGYLTSYTETDPIYVASTWYSTTNNSANWDTAYGWGNHASAGYLTGITGQSIKNLSDVYSSMSPTDGQVLTYDTTNGWQAGDSFSIGSVSGASQVLDISSHNFFSSAKMTADITLSFSNVPTNAKWDYTIEADAVTPWVLSAGTFVNEFSISSEDTVPTGVWFKSDGTKMYVLGRMNARVFQYSLSTAWDISTASYDSVSFSVSSEDGLPWGFSFKPDGTKMYMCGLTAETVYQYTLSTTWDMSTASYDSKSFSIATQNQNPAGVVFKSDGTKMYVLATYYGDKVHQYSLSTAWDVSTASYDSVELNVETQESLADDLFFKDDGTKLYVVGRQNDSVFEYSLSTAWDLSTASYNNTSLSVSEATNADPTGLYISPNGIDLYVTDYNPDTVRQYNIQAAGSITLPASVKNSPQLSFKSNRVTYTFFTQDGGTNIYLINEQVLGA